MGAAVVDYEAFELAEGGGADGFRGAGGGGESLEGQVLGAEGAEDVDYCGVVPDTVDGISRGDCGGVWRFYSLVDHHMVRNPSASLLKASEVVCPV